MGGGKIVFDLERRPEQFRRLGQTPLEGRGQSGKMGGVEVRGSRRKLASAERPHGNAHRVKADIDIMNFAGHPLG